VGSAESRVAYSTPAARPTKTSLFFPLPATPLQWGSPRAGGGSEPSRAWGTLHGEGDEGRAPLWETLAGAARGGASRRQPLDTQPHDAWRAKTLRL